MKEENRTKSGGGRKKETNGGKDWYLYFMFMVELVGNLDAPYLLYRYIHSGVLIF